MKEKIVARIKTMKKEQMIIFLLLLGLAVVISIPTKKENDTGSQESADGSDLNDATQENQISDSKQGELEEQLENTLRKVEGVGDVAVAITMESTGEKIVEKDTPTNDSKTSQQDSQGGTQESVTQSQDESTVYTQDEQGNQIPYVVSETAPQIRGVIVVAQGGNDPVIVQQIQEAVMALFHVEAHKIKVMKMK